jgi:N-acetylmuramoyl-L-alanine amidase
MGSGSARRTAVRFTRFAAWLAVTIAAPTLAAAQAPPAALPADATSGVTAARETALAGDKGRTRFVIGLERDVQFQVFSLANPFRVIVDLPDVKFQLPAATGATVGLVKSFYGGLSAPGRVRVVIDVTSPVIVDKTTVEKGRDGRSPRLVLEIVPVDPARQTAQRKGAPTQPMGAGLMGVQPPIPKAAQRPRQREEATYRPLIVIDPGHGGHDSGAQKFGTVEKDVVLAFSLKLRDKLLATGRYRVLMTRETDVFVELDDRREFGDKHNAALFIAVHADYAGSNARGATIYSPRDSIFTSMQRVAKREATEKVLSEREMDQIRRTGGDTNAIASILGSLAEREIEANRDRTNLFSRSALEFMSSSTPIMNNPEREANFRVLQSAKTPSVLIELAFVTNAEDARNLRSDSWRDRVTNSLMTAIENYFSHKASRIPL